MRPLLVLATSCLTAASLAAQGDELFTVSPGDGNLRVVDPLTLATVRTTAMVTNNGQPVTGGNGLALHPTTGQLWGLVRIGTGNTRHLARIDRATAVATVIAATSDLFAGIAFRGDGTLFGVTGDGANTPETLFTIALGTAASTLVRALGAGTGGEAIAFSPADNAFYHASGFGTPNVDEVFERLDRITGAPTPVTLSGYDYEEILGLTHWTGGNLLGVDYNYDLVVISGSGRVTLLGTLDHGAKGLAFVPSPTTVPYLRAYGAGCAASTGEIPLLWGIGVPRIGQAFSLEVRLAPAGSFGVLAVGAGNGSTPFPSAQCRAQINPVVTAVAFFAGPTGAATFPIAVPAILVPGDIFAQAALLQGGAFLVANPLQVHVH